MNFLRKIMAFALVLVLMSAPMAAYANPDTSNNSNSGETDPYTPVEEIVYATASVNVRTGPGMSYKVIATLSRGDAVLRVGVDASNWDRVLFNGQEAYVYTTYLTATNPILGSGGSTGALDHNNLLQQIAIANGLKAQEYTLESWDALVLALEQATQALNAAEQEKVDAAVVELKAAISALVTMDFSVLEKAVTQAEEFMAGNRQLAAAQSLCNAIRDAESLYSSGDQAAVDARAEEICALLEQLKALVEESSKPNVVIQEVEVEVPPTGDYCNIPSHRYWQLLFFGSLALNLVLGVVLLVILKKKSNRGEDVPLVDYDIDDDM